MKEKQTVRKRPASHSLTTPPAKSKKSKDGTETPSPEKIGKKVAAKKKDGTETPSPEKIGKKQQSGEKAKKKIVFHKPAASKERLQSELIGEHVGRFERGFHDMSFKVVSQEFFHIYVFAFCTCLL